MFVQSTLRRAVRLALYAGGAAAALVAGTATAQDQDQAESAEDVETVIVTGSRIQRPELEATVPMVTLGQEDFAAQGFENFADLAVSLPQFAPSFGSSRSQSTFSGAASSGLNTVNLRNLGDVRTVVLVNGRRVPGGTSTSTRVDFNTLPTANIERIELLTGGASAVYGADAVAGVVNIITKKNFEGIEIGASYGAADEGDNQNPSGHIMIGGSFADRGRGLLTLQYDRQGQVSCADRALCEEDFAWNNPATILRGPAAYSGVGLQPRVFMPNGTSVTRRGGSWTDASGALIPFSVPVDGYNRNAARDLAIPTKRLMVAAEGEYELARSVYAFAEVNYGQSETDSRFEGHPFQSQQPGSLVGGGPGVAGLQATIPLSNPFVPAALRTAYENQLAAQNPPGNPATALITWWQRFNFGGFRGADNNRETVRATGGFRGELDSIGFGENWTWEIHHVYGRTSLDGLTEGLVGTDRLYNALRVEQTPGAPAGTFRCVDAAARALGCIPVDPFADLTPAMLDYLTLSAGQNGQSELEDSQAFITGSPFNLPAGPFQAVLGLERRAFSGFLDYDEAINRGLATGNQIGDVDFAEIVAKEVYGEALVPVLRDLPFARTVSLEAAYRRSDTDVGDYGTWKYGGEWAPVEGFRLRAMRARSVRAPIPGELSGIGQTFGVVQDPCTQARRNTGPNPTVRAANCTADGVPADYVPPLVVEQSVAGFNGGNPALTPEEATTLTYGFVFTPTFLRNFSLTVDRFLIDVEDIITVVARQDQANRCYDTADRLFCDQLQRGANPVVPGANYVLNSVNEQLQNVAALEVAGFDVEARYGFNLGGAGKLDVQAQMTFYDKADQLPIPGAEVRDLLGTAGGSTIDQGFLKRQGFLNVNYLRGPLAANWRTRYLGAADMSAFVEGFPRIGSHAYHNVRLAYLMGDASEVFLGVNNVFDKEPPLFASGTSGTQALDTIPGYYDVYGRSYFGGVRVKF